MMNSSSEKMGKSIRRIGEEAERVGKQMQSVGKTMTMSLTLPIVGAGTAMFKMHKDFEFSMSQIVGLVGESREQVDAWGKDILKMAPKLGKAPKELADALFFVTSAGIKGAAAMDTLEMSAKASAAGLGETKIVADLVTSAMNAYGQENLNAGQATDILVAAVREGKAEAPELAAAMGSVLPIASEMKVSFDQVGAAVAAMTRTGTDASTATMQLKNIMAAFLKPTDQAEQALQSMGTSSEEFRRIISEDGLFAALTKLKGLHEEYGETTISEVVPNLRAMLGVFDLVGANMKDNIAISERMKDTTGALNHAYEAASETAEMKWRKALVSGQTALINMGNAVSKVAIPMLEQLSEWINKASDWWTSLSEATQKTIVKTLAIVAAIGPLLYIGGKLLVLFGTLTKVAGFLQVAFVGARAAMVALNTAMMANPLGVFIGLAVAAVAAVYALNKAFTKLTEEQKSLQKVQKQVQDATREEAAEIDLLTKIIENHNIPLERRKKAIEDLKKIVPGYLGHLTEEGKLINHNTIALRDYLVERKNEARLMAMKDREKELAVEMQREIEKLTNLELARAELLEKGLSKGSSKMLILEDNIQKTRQAIDEKEGAMNRMIESHTKFGASIEKTKKSTEEWRKTLPGTEEFNMLGSFTPQVEDLTEAVDDNTEAVDDNVGAVREVVGVWEKLNAETKKWRDMEAQAATMTQAAAFRKLGDDAEKAQAQYETMLNIMGTPLKPIQGKGMEGPGLQQRTAPGVDKEALDSFNQWIDAMSAADYRASIFGDSNDILQEKINATAAALLLMGDGVGFTDEQFRVMTETYDELISKQETVTEGMSVIGEAALQMGQALMAAGIQGAGSLKEFGQTALEVARKTIAAFIAEGIAGVVKNALVSVPPPFNIALATAAGGLAAGLFNAMVPKLRLGGEIPPGFPNDSYPAFLSSGEKVIPAADPLPMSFGQGDKGLKAVIENAGADLVLWLTEQQRRLQGV